MVSQAFKNRTRDEVIAAFRESIRKKHEWQKKAEEDIKRIRQERLQLSL
ncbi:MAG: 30S ribosomal protein S7 [Prevotella sp.]|nr:30S ribosomal protein S7 [Prevotella sp.]